MFRIGIGYDVHRLQKGRMLVLGGVTIPFERGLAGHSDADVLLHAVCDSLLGAIGAGDIGQHFPDTDLRWRDVDSSILLERVMQLVTEKGYRVVNIDTTIIAEVPKVSPYRDSMRQKVATLLGVDLNRVNIKATTTEKLGFEGREEGIAAQAIVLIRSDREKE